MKTVFYILGIIAFAVIVIIVFLMLKNKKSLTEVVNEVANPGGTGTNGVGYNGVTTVPTGTPLPDGRMVTISQLDQKLLSGLPFATNPDILDGTVQIVKKTNKALSEVGAGRFFIWDKATIGWIRGEAFRIGTAGIADCQGRDPEQLVQGVKYKNLIWQRTTETPITPKGRPFNGGSDALLYRCHAKFHYIEGTNEVRELASHIIADFMNNQSQWVYVSTTDTQNNINLYLNEPG